MPVETETFRELESHWSILISGQFHMDQSLVHTSSWGNSYGPTVLKVLLRFPPTLALVHGWLFPEQDRRIRSDDSLKKFAEKCAGNLPKICHTKQKHSIKIRSPEPRHQQMGGVLRYKWEAYRDTNGRSTDNTMGNEIVSKSIQKRPNSITAVVN